MTSLAPLMVELLYDHAPAVDMERLTEKVRAFCGLVNPDHLPDPAGDSAHYFMLNGLAEFAEGRLPTQLCLGPMVQEAGRDTLTPSLLQTWDWPEAPAVTACCTHAMLAHDFMATTMDPAARTRQFNGFLRALQEVAPCQAMNRISTQVVVNPERLQSLQEEDGNQACYGSINVRFFRLEDADDEYLMDTLGLAVLGLPDIQCHFREFSPADISRVLRDTAGYLLEHGDIIADGETVRGIEENDRWCCQHEMALAVPPRIVLDLNPGPLYAGGDRNN